ncbi:germination protease [Clostridium sp. CAG:230]|nr:GPR endopeptidase [Lachnospiraceae bacterium]PWL67977.1 MAG: GPR endopeptidase [Clostridiaceae bacterium]CDA85903.1 germination protease [Clostridium sp. CAG:230]
MRYEKRTDLAIEVKESFPKDHVEIPGVSLQENYDKLKKIKVTSVQIMNHIGARQMKKPIGTYTTIDFEERFIFEQKDYMDAVGKRLQKELAAILPHKIKKDATILVTGLGNRFATPDALGPYVLEQIEVNRHLSVQYVGMELQKGMKICGMIPGVLGQTGMESSEILKGVIENVHPDCMLVIDSLATRSIKRLCTTIQLTDTGISPGAGIGNNRSEINQNTMNIPVIAIGVPTVVEAGTIVYDTLEAALQKEGYSTKEIALFFDRIHDKMGDSFFVTPKDIDEKIKTVGDMIANSINACLAG